MGTTQASARKRVIYDHIVIGGGVVGLAISRSLTCRKCGEAAIIETSSTYGTGTSGRNSEIIHSGLYYPPGSLRARLCVTGKHLLYQYCLEKGIPHKRLGKLLVATDNQQVEKLREYKKTGETNGVHDLEWLEAEDVQKLEPDLQCKAAIFSPSTGVVDSQSLMQSLLADAQYGGTQFLTHKEVIGGDITGKIKKVRVRDTRSGEIAELQTHNVVNAAGLYAQKVSKCLGVPAQQVPKQHLAKGNYFALRGRAPFRHLIYPMPKEGGLGTHLTLDLRGHAKFGPDVEYVEEVDYTVDPSRGNAFYAAIRDYWPGLPDGALQPKFSGIRPKIHAPGTPQADFVIDCDSVHGMVSLYGIESPGLTSCLAIGAYVADKLALQRSSQSKL